LRPASAVLPAISLSKPSHAGWYGSLMGSASKSIPTSAYIKVAKGYNDARQFGGFAVNDIFVPGFQMLPAMMQRVCVMAIAKVAGTAVGFGCTTAAASVATSCVATVAAVSAASAVPACTALPIAVGAVCGGANVFTRMMVSPVSKKACGTK
jgi:hypothetical protein